MSDELGVEELQSINRGRKVARKGVKGGRKKKGERPDANLNATKLRRRKLTYSFAAVPRENWAKAFGDRTPEEQAAVFRRALEEQRARRQSVEPRPRATAIHGDNKGMGRRLHRGFNPGLGCFIEGRTHERAMMAKLGVVATG